MGVEEVEIECTTLNHSSMFRAARSLDVDSIAKIASEVHNIHYEIDAHYFKSTGQADLKAQIESILNQYGFDIFVCVHDDVISGYCIYEIIEKEANHCSQFRRSIHIHQLGVISNCRGKGIGKALVDKVFSVAKSKQILEIDVSLWAKNAKTKAFYKKVVFQDYREKMTIKI